MGFFVSSSAFFAFARACMALFTILSSSEWNDMTAILPPGFTHSSAFSRNSAIFSNSPFTNILSAWNTFVAGCILPLLPPGTARSIASASARVVMILAFLRVSTSACAIGRAYRSSPYVLKMSVSASSEEPFTTAAAVSLPSSRAYRISRGPSPRKLNPRSGASIWKEENPRSTITPSAFGRCAS